ncbi:ABC transporter permease [Nocardiopsis algeriensis]|uniref:Peptide/nickel transport system permease protein n=1 Tax=Nocardiopsis algeriensis TaxID=1478215 RepID=A0A841IRI7_9ACTN|nr:ABC transporter permease [Nocardiopsis algeriensis]MBB6120854.1 peptide/nickel transport system permease protein [Nocardiopsis algeriensis]
MRVFVRLALRRLLVLPVMLLGVSMLVFVVLQFSPNDPAYNALGVGASAEARAAYAAEHGLDQPLPVQYVRFLGQLLQGDLGMTAPPATPVSERIADAFPLTLQLTLLGMGGAIVFALAMGLAGALWRDRWPDQVTRVVSIACIALPPFWLAILLIQQFSLGLGLFPTGGYVPPEDSIWKWLVALTLPAASVAVPIGAQLSRLVRTSMVEELDRDYVRTATGNGLPRWLVLRGALRNALITPMTVLGWRFGYAMGGAVVIETIFNLPGMGQLLLIGVTNGDVALVQGAVLTVAIALLVVNLVIDLLYVVVNPRIREV